MWMHLRRWNHQSGIRFRICPLSKLIIKSFQIQVSHVTWVLSGRRYAFRSVFCCHTKEKLLRASATLEHGFGSPIQGLMEAPAACHHHEAGGSWLGAGCLFLAGTQKATRTSLAGCGMRACCLDMKRSSLGTNKQSPSQLNRTNVGKTTPRGRWTSLYSTPNLIHGTFQDKLKCRFFSLMKRLLEIQQLQWWVLLNSVIFSAFSPW